MSGGENIGKTLAQPKLPGADKKLTLTLGASKTGFDPTQSKLKAPNVSSLAKKTNVIKDMDEDEDDEKNQRFGDRVIDVVCFS